MCWRQASLFLALPWQRYRVLLIVAFRLYLYSSIPVVFTQTFSTTAAPSSYLQFPNLFNVAQNRPISTSPSAAVCGVQTVDGYCASSASPSSVTSCLLSVCSISCPYRSSTPPRIDLIAPPTPSTACSSADYINLRPGASPSSASTLFVVAGGQTTCYLTPSTVPVLGVNGSFSLSFWVWPISTSLGTVLDKYIMSGSTSIVILRIQISISNMRITYRSTNSSSQILNFSLWPPLPLRSWTNIALQVFGSAVSYFVNGTDPGWAARGTSLLVGTVADSSGASARVGLTVAETDQFVGRLQDVWFYSVTLVNREFDEVFYGALPVDRILSSCRCPPDFPRANPLISNVCVKNGVLLNASTTETVSRLSTTAHPLEYANDGLLSTWWISTPLSRVSVTISFGDMFEVFYVSLQLYSPLPKAITLSKQTSLSSFEWQTWQYYADDCKLYFDMTNNGELQSPDDTNCLQLVGTNSTTSFSQATITFIALSASRPGSLNYYNSPALVAFVKASGIQVLMQGHYYDDLPLDARHQYYSLYEVTVTGRCFCNGHAASCDTTTLPYNCNCLPESFTQGKKCEQCLPMYNDKPFRAGDQVNLNPCRLCECNGHANSCVYDSSVDPYPNSTTIGSGGVCIRCANNTTGQFCENCLVGFYRSTGIPSDGCVTCDCHLPGTDDQSGTCEQAGGQCSCKTNVQGRRCDQCKVGFFNLQLSNTLGCSSCECNLNGVVNANAACNQTDGSCQCKANVVGAKCDQCRPTFYSLQSANPLGCSSCDCEPTKSVSLVCHSVSGQCTCAANAMGRQCSRCATGFYDNTERCESCSCDRAGITQGSCDAVSGNCYCKSNVVGLRCDACLIGYWYLDANNPDGCKSCNCNAYGTVPGTTCDLVSGQCSCRERVQGTLCDNCVNGYYNVTAGCLTCGCDPTGTVSGSIACDQNTGQCRCLSNRVGQKCNVCAPGYYADSTIGGGCLPCSCNSTGAIQGAPCDAATGQCQCLLGGSGVGGIRCDTCLPGYYNRNPNSGRCQECSCDTAGSTGFICDVITGQCPCKMYTTSLTCGQCQPGTSDLDASNPYGCSRAPSNQPPPDCRALNASSILLTWAQPDNPNGVIQSFKVYRNGTLIYTTFENETEFLDVNLSPFTLYEYRVQADNGFGTALSVPVVYRTSPGIPSGSFTVNLGSIGQRTVAIFWTAPSSPNGPIQRYLLKSTTHLNSTVVLRYEGLGLSTTLSGLMPYTRYTLVVTACTAGGCRDANDVNAVTLQAPPANQLAPIVTPIGPTRLLVNWSPPRTPNGVIIFYELWLLVVRRSGAAQLVFNPSGQYDPLGMSAVLPPPATTFTVNDLSPFTEYDLQVVAQNQAGKVSSNWTRSRTAEATPLFMPRPSVLAINSATVNISWPCPDLTTQVRGHILNYSVYQFTAQQTSTSGLWTLLVVWNGNQCFGLLSGFTAYTNVTVVVGVCNSVGCVNSSIATGTTAISVAQGLSELVVDGFNASEMSISWSPPVLLNGPSPVYVVNRYSPAFSIPPQRVETGYHFTGVNYILFPPETIPQGVTFTGISLSFRTIQETVLLFFAASVGDQEEYIVIQMSEGRLWFLFNPQGCETAVTTTNDENMKYNNGLWQQVTVTRIGKQGYITVNNTNATYSGGPVQTACTTGTVMGNNTGVYIGGLPNGFIIQRNDSESRAKVTQAGLQGCIGSVLILTQATPTETWVPLDWATAVGLSERSLLWEGCPLMPQTALAQNSGYYLGSGYVTLEPGTFLGGSNMAISLQLRTQQSNGLILFAFGGAGSYFLLEIVNSALLWKVAVFGRVMSVAFNSSSISLCNGLWHSVVLTTIGQNMTITVDSVPVTSAGNSSSATISLSVSSYFYIGGIPPEDSEAAKFISSNGLSADLLNNFAGCLQNTIFINQNAVSIPLSMVDGRNIRFDGCPDITSNMQSCFSTVSQPVYSGLIPGAYDTGLSSFTEYLYQLEVRNEAGTAKSQWNVGRTRPGPPMSTPQPTAGFTPGQRIQVVWSSPTYNTGIITMYIVRGFIDFESSPSVVMNVSGTTFSVLILDVIPYKNYSITVSACTAGGCTESVPFSLRTPAISPLNVDPPIALDVGATYLVLSWKIPVLINGILTGFTLLEDNLGTVYSGAQMSFNLTGLRVFTPYYFSLRVCNTAGCATSLITSISTGQLPPSGVLQPGLTVLGTDRIRVDWSAPSSVNGILRRYIVYFSVTSSSVGLVVYNSTDLLQFFTMTNLSVGTQYFVRLSACTDGGCAISSATQAVTLESAPALVQMPSVASPSPTQLDVKCLEPLSPNGVITRYFLYHNGLLTYNDSSPCSLTISDLLPWTIHTFWQEVCTARGCARSDELTVRTQEAPPVGGIGLQLRVSGARQLSIYWTPVSTLNGLLYYTVYAHGMFYNNPENNDYGLRTLRRNMLVTLSSPSSSSWITINGLLPYSNYSILVNGSNTRGFVLSNVLLATMPMAEPDGVMPPNLTSPTPSSVFVTWGTIGRINSDQQPAFQLQFKDSPTSANIVDLFLSTTVATSFTKTGLDPYSEYAFRVVASTIHGQTSSNWSFVVTAQDRPSDLDPPLISIIGARSLMLSWQPPSQPNGIVDSYTIFQNGSDSQTINGSVTSFNVTGLVPNSNYTFYIAACTAGGCTNSASSRRVITASAAPDGVLPPVLYSQTPSSVVINWSPPTSPNGVITQYTVQRTVPSLTNLSAIVVVGTFPTSDLTVYSFVDSSPVISPYTNYLYRVGASTQGGVAYSEWSSITTMSSRPGGLIAPRVTVSSPTSLLILWSPPLNPNGLLQYYTLQLPWPRFTVSNISQLSMTVSELTAYTTYNVTVTACSDGGCTESPVTMVTTSPSTPGDVQPPTAIAVSQTYITVSWQATSAPNGPNVRYELTRIKLRQPLNSAAIGFGSWVSLYTGSTMFSYEDRGLSMYTIYQYRMTVYNDFAFTISPSSEQVATFGGVPTQAANITVMPVNHTAILVNWTLPSIMSLNGGVDQLIANFTSQNASSLNPQNVSRLQSLDITQSSGTINGLSPDTVYSVTVTIIILGGASITSETRYVQTMVGTPVGLTAPSVRAVNDTALRVNWVPPARPNGPITNYFIYINGLKLDPQTSSPISYVIGRLQPYTAYNIQLEACTIYACGLSQTVRVATAESFPSGLASPLVNAVNHSSIAVSWTGPSQPNGIILRYELVRVAWLPCAFVPTTPASTTRTCSYITCSPLQNFCGSQCYSGPKTCCGGSQLYDNRQGYECCGTSYIMSRTNTNDVCCGGQFQTYLNGYQCCFDRYVRVNNGQVCCRDSTEDRVTVDLGDLCCGGVPYYANGSQICCNGQLLNAYGSQCCGGHVVGSDLVCCGDEADGQWYTRNTSNICCGTDYVELLTTTCCIDETGRSTSFHYASALVRNISNEKCCGLSLIPAAMSCCGELNAYNPVNQTCADISSMLSGCGTGTVCPTSRSAMAYCDRCNFNRAAQICGSFSISTSNNDVPNENNLCLDGPSTVYVGSNLMFIDTSLMPYTQYNYSVAAINSVGAIYSSASSAITWQDLPVGLASPIYQIKSDQLDIIFLSWSPPSQPNGVILWYALLRGGYEIFRDPIALTYADNNAIQPFNTYSYSVEACNSAGCVQSSQIVAATKEGKPSLVAPPIVISLTSRSINLGWSQPGSPNGRLINYTLVQVAPLPVVIRTFSSDDQLYSLAVDGLVPYSQYQYLINVCTSVGCSNSTVTTVSTLQDRPFGVEAPELIVVNSSQVEIYWTSPTVPNGIITSYRLYRSTSGLQFAVWFTGDGSVYNTVDTTAQPLYQYSYILEAATIAGRTNSSRNTVTLPSVAPNNIPAPFNVTALSAYSISVEWNSVKVVNYSLDIYYVLLNAGTSYETIWPAISTSLVISGLTPFTFYQARIRACIQGIANGCGMGPPAAGVRTFEALPAGQTVPKLSALGPISVAVAWEPPDSPNGRILQYLVERRTASELSEGDGRTINTVNGTSLSIVDYGVDLSPFTTYEYRVTAVNSLGQVRSNWSAVQTLEAAPSGLKSPTISAVGSYSFIATWSAPATPNGVILFYKLEYSAVTNVQSPTSSITVSGLVLSTSVSGVQPNSNYAVRINASNSVGSVSSAWTRFTTSIATPANIGSISVRAQSDGKSAMLSWSVPTHPNGAVTSYAVYLNGNINPVYQGTSLKFLLTGLQPFTTYSICLEACTMAGCTRSLWQQFSTLSVPPINQPAPSVLFVNSTAVSLQWGPPGNSYGLLLGYSVYRSTSFNGATVQTMIFSTPDTGRTVYSFTDSTVQPYTSYSFFIRVSNAAGSTDSPVMSVLTSESAPLQTLPPSVHTIPGQYSQLSIKWLPPAQPNGLIRNYILQRNGTTPWNFAANGGLNFTDQGLAANTVYSYTVTVCTGGGCTSSLPTSATTLESSPNFVIPPIAQTLNSTAISVSWLTPSTSNGLIISYELRRNGSSIFVGLSNGFVAANLAPFQTYSFVLTACTGGGCSNSTPVTCQTGEESPTGMVAPLLRVTGTTSIEISWSPPSRPNGVITSYELRRNSILIQTTSLTWYIDYGVEPGTTYQYQVSAYNSQGRAASPSSIATTFASSPTGILPPVTVPLSASSVSVSWAPPAEPNGVIVNYTLYVGPVAVYIGLSQATVVTGLTAWTHYSLVIAACTTAGCTYSDAVSVQTPEAAPQNIDPPRLSTSEIGVILVQWNQPLSPNGVVTSFDLYRRKYSALTDSDEIIYSGLAFQYVDRSSELLPYSVYQYAVSAVNSVGRVISQWANIRTAESIPSGISAPVVLGVTATSVTVQISRPLQPNGLVHFNIFVNSTMVQRINSNQTELTSLKPRSLYTVRADACTSAGCTSSPTITVVTLSDLPRDLQSPSVSNVTSTSIYLNWTDPEVTNGKIVAFKLVTRTSCPYPYADVTDSVVIPCVIGPLITVINDLVYSVQVVNMTPFTKYEFQLNVWNEAGLSDQPAVTFATTLSAAPSYRVDQPLTLQLSNVVVTVSWVSTFYINAEVINFSFFVNSTATYVGPATSYGYTMPSKLQTYIFYVVLTTTHGSASTPKMLFDPSQPEYFVIYTPTTAMATGPSSEKPTTTSSPPSSFYSETWFIITVAVAGFILLVVVMVIVHKVCCSRAVPYEYAKEQGRSDPPSPWQPPQYSADQYASDDDVFDDYLQKSKTIRGNEVKRVSQKEFHQTQDTTKEDISISSVSSSPTHYSHRSFVSLADFYLDPVETGPVNWDLVHPGGRDSGLNSILFEDEYEANSDRPLSAVRNRLTALNDTRV